MRGSTVYNAPALPGVNEIRENSEILFLPRINTHGRKGHPNGRAGDTATLRRVPIEQRTVDEIGTSHFFAADY